MAAYTEDAREQALVRLMEQYGDGIKRICCVYLRDLSAAEDAAQETFIKAYDHIEPLLGDEIMNERAWLSRIAINTCKDMLRSSWMRHIDRRKAIEELPLCVYPGHEDSLAITQAIAALPVKLKEIVLLHYYQGLGIAEIAQLLGLPEGTISSRLSRARKKLEILLKEEATGE